MSKNRSQIVRVSQRETGIKKYRTATAVEAEVERERRTAEMMVGLRPRSIAKVRKNRAEEPKGEPSKGFVSSIYGRTKY